MGASNLLGSRWPEAAIVADYVSGINTPAIQKKYGIHPFVSTQILRRHGVSVRTSGAWSRKYTFDEHIFDSIDTQDKAYWLGFIAGDGCITPKGQLDIRLASYDREILEAFRSFVGGDFPIHPRRYKNGPILDYPSIGITLRKCAFTPALANFGIVTNKMWTLRWPTTLPDSLMSHFLRGFSDADGCFLIHYRGRTHNRYSWTLTKNGEFLQGCKDYLQQRLEIKFGKLSKTGNIHILRLHRQEYVQTLVQWLYKDATTFLKRKRAVIEPLFGAPVIDMRKQKRKLK